MTRSRIMLVLISFLIGIIGGAAHASFTLSDSNSTADFDSSSGGLINWNVDGTDQMDQEWFWIRVGSTGVAQQLQNLGSITEPSGSVGPAASVAYANSVVRVDILWSLAGGANYSGYSQLTEQIRIRNLTKQTQTISLFEFTDFDLGNAALDKASVVQNVSGLYDTVSQWDVAGDTGEVSAVATFAADRYEMSTTHGTIPTKLDTVAGYNLNNTGAPVTTWSDVEFALQWDRTLAPETSVIIQKSKTVQLGPVPEAGTMVLFCLGILGVGLARRSRKA